MQTSSGCNLITLPSFRCTALQMSPLSKGRYASTFRIRFGVSFIPFKLLLLVCLLAGADAYADQVIVNQADADQDDESSALILPYAFATEALETGFGAVYYRKGLFQENDGAFLTGYGTTNSSFGVFGGLRRSQLSSRLFLDVTFGYMSNEEQRFYGDFGYDVNEIPSGSNESVIEDFLAGSGIDSYFDIDLRYVLPIGGASDSQPQEYTIRDGFLVGGSALKGRWNPFKSGRTILHVKPFYQRRTIEVTDENVDFFPPNFPVQVGEEPDSTTAGLTLGLEYDNTDFPVNPSRGSRTLLNVSRDFGALDTFNTWTSVDFSFSKYWNLGESDTFAQRSIAANFWAAYSPTWETVELTPDFIAYAHRPPSNLGASLGGVDRQRGYPRGRFNDKAAINYALELRLVPRWDPFKNWPLIRNYPWRWWQAVVFAEVGRVAPSWSLSDLHEDMKWSAGAGIRAMIGGAIVRLEFATSEDSAGVWVMGSHPF